MKTQALKGMRDLLPAEQTLLFFFKQKTAYEIGQ